jgi:predicted AlkP superfamily pyrophosphatase or phosphodiesterase
LPPLFAQTAPPPKAPAKAPARPKLVLVVVADQFRADYLLRFRSLYTAGFKRMMDRGAWFTNAFYDHMPTVTAVGHSIILSGAMPAATGIVGNEWWDRATNKQVSSVSDSSVETLGTPGRAAASPHRLLASTIGDELKMSGRAPVKVIGISYKDRAAILPAGRMADAAYWFDDTNGRFVSSTWYMKSLPAWVESFNSSKVADQWLGKPWTPLAGGKDFSVLPETASGTGYYRKMEGTRFGNDFLELFAEAAIENEKLGHNGGIDLLSVSFSTNDVVGHAKGPHSPEVQDVSVDTDRALGRLFDFLEKKIGMANVLVVFTADHGVSPMPEYMTDHHMGAGRIPESQTLDAVEKALTARYGEGPWVAGKSGPTPYLDHKLIQAKNLDLDEVQQVAAQAVRMLPHIARVYTREELRRGHAQNDAVGNRVQNGFFYQRASDLVIIPEAFWIFDKSGTSHGAPWNYDAHVPVLFYGPAVKPGLYHQRIAVVDIAPTLATILEIEPPSGAFGRPLTEILR